MSPTTDQASSNIIYMSESVRPQSSDSTLVTPRESRVTLQSWLWTQPAKHSTGQIEELLERIATLYELGIHQHFADVPDDLRRRYARRAWRIGTDGLLPTVRRRVADLSRPATTDANRVSIHWADLYRELLTSVTALANDAKVADKDARIKLRTLVPEHLQRKPPTRAQLVRDHLTL